MNDEDKDATEQQIQDKLTEIIDTHKDKSIRLLAKLVFNLRFDLDELKVKLYETLIGAKGYDSNEEGVELKYPTKKIDKEAKRIYGLYS